MVPFNLALVVTSLVVISIHVFMRRRSCLFCFSKDASAVKIAGVVLHRVGIFGFFFSKQCQGLRPSAAHPYPNIGRVPPPPPSQRHTYTQILVEYPPHPPLPAAHLYPNIGRVPPPPPPSGTPIPKYWSSTLPTPPSQRHTYTQILVEYPPHPLRR